MRWIMIGLTLLGFALAFVAKGPGLLGIGLVLGFVGLVGTVLALAADRIAASARPESTMYPAEDIVALRKRQAAATAAGKAAPVTKISSAPESAKLR